MKKIIKTLHHYAHAIEIRCLITHEYLRLRKLDKNYPSRLIGKIWRDPHIMKDSIQLSRFLSTKDKILIIDIGAHTGYWAEEIVNVFSHSSLVAIEPDKKALLKYVERFKGKLAMSVHNIALSNKKGEAKMNLAKFSAYSSLEEYDFTTKGKSEFVEEIDVEMSTLDAISINTDGFDRIFVKIVVQGHEAKVVEGGLKLLSKADVVLVELSFAPEYSGNQPSFSSVSSMLYSCGLHPVIFQDYGRIRSPYAWQRSVIFVRSKLLDRILHW